MISDPFSPPSTPARELINNPDHEKVLHWVTRLFLFSAGMIFIGIVVAHFAIYKPMAAEVRPSQNTITRDVLVSLLFLPGSLFVLQAITRKWIPFRSNPTNC